MSVMCPKGQRFAKARMHLPGHSLRQLCQVTREEEEGERTRIMYFCPACQNTWVALKNGHKQRSTARPASNAPVKKGIAAAKPD